MGNKLFECESVDGYFMEFGGHKGQDHQEIFMQNNLQGTEI